MSVQNLNINVLNTMDLTVSFQYDNLVNSSINFRKEKKFNISKNKTNLLHIILNTDIGSKFKIMDCTIFQLVEVKPFNSFQMRHKHTNYFKLFNKKIPNKKNYFVKDKKFKGKLVYHYTEEKKCENQIHFAQIREAFRKIIYQIVSQELIGNNRNKKKILKTFHNFLLTAKTEPFTLCSLMKQINILSIKWLKEIKDQQKKFILFAKFIKWLFQYFIQILFCQFHISYIKGERVFILFQDWKIQNNNFIKKMKYKMAFEPLDEVTKINKIKNRIVLIPKYKGVRCVLIQKYTDKEKQKLRQIMSILKYLYETYLENMDNCFSKKFIQFYKEINNCNNKTYIISSDISNAYGSIKQVKLFNILMSMFEKLPDQLLFKWYITKNLKNYKFMNVDTKLIKTQYINDNKLEISKKFCILQILKEFIYSTKIIINNIEFNLCKGLPQGLMLSSILCDIYYAHMRKNYFADFNNYGFYFGYVDDSIYLTNSLIHANQYINRIKKGIPEYNCWFNESKLKFNLSNCVTSNSNKIQYLGWKIDASSLEIEPKYSSARYSITYKLLYSKYDFKIQNLTSLKLNKLILYKKINSKKQIFNNVKLIALHHAKRCYAIAYIFYENQYTLSIKSIWKSNLKILYKIENLTKWDKMEKKRNRKKLQYIIWKAFYDIFNKKRVIFVHLIKEYEKLIKIYKI